MQYVLYGPLVANGLYSLYEEGNINNIVHNWCLHILLISFLRVGIHICWSSYSTMLFLTRNRRILQQGVDFKQIDMEWDWYIYISVSVSPILSNYGFIFLFFLWFVCFGRDNFLLLQALISSMVIYLFPSLGNLPLWNTKGFIAVLILHVVVAEPLFYVLHRFFHTDYFFAHYHSLHHSSPVPQSFTGDPTN